jgi:hypothetical protein
MQQETQRRTRGLRVRRDGTERSVIAAILPVGLATDVRCAAVEHGISLSEFVATALRAQLDREDSKPEGT